MERAILMCRETDLNLEVMISEPPKVGSRLKIKRRIDKKIMNIYRVDSFEYATYEFRAPHVDAEEERKRRYEIPVMRCEIKLTPLYYNYHHKTEYIKKYCCANCEHIFVDPRVKEGQIQTGQCGNPKSEKNGKTVYDRNICLQGYLEMKGNDTIEAEEVEIYKD